MPPHKSHTTRCSTLCCAFLAFIVVAFGVAITFVDVTVHSCSVYVPPRRWGESLATIGRAVAQYATEHGWRTLLSNMGQLFSDKIAFLSPPLSSDQIGKVVGKRVLMVGGSYVPQFLSRAHQMGAEVYLLDDADKTPMRARDLAAGFIPVRDFSRVSILEPELAVEAVKATGIKFDGVLTLVEDEGPLAARLARVLGVPGTPEAAAMVARNKYLVRQKMAEAGLPVPRFAMIDADGDQVERAAELVGLPAFLKPIYGVASSYVAKVKSVEDIRRHFLHFQRNVDRDYFPIYHYGTPMLLEGMLGGHEIQVEVLLRRGKLVGHCFSSHYSPGRDWVVFPTNLTACEKDEMLELAVATSKAIGLTDGVTHYEFFHQPGMQPHVIEVNNRLSRGFLCLEFSHQMVFGECLADYFGSVVMLSLGLDPLTSPRSRPMVAMAAFPDKTSTTGWETQSPCAVYFGLDADEAVAKGMANRNFV